VCSSDLDAPNPTITTQPQSGSFQQNQNLNLSIAATHISNDKTLTYQWYSSASSAGTNGVLIGGATSANYTSAASGLEYGSHYYYCVVTVTDNNAMTTKIGTITSNTVEVSILPASTVTATVNTATKYQYVRGFGAISSVSFRAGIGSASPDMTVADTETMFNPNGAVGLNMLRIPMYDDIRGFVSNTIKGAGTFGGNNTDNSDYYDIIKKDNQYGGYVYACPWTVPASFKTNNALTGGGTVRTNQYTNVATNFFKDFLDLLNLQGAPIYGISVQNEPDFTSKYEGTEYSDTQMRDFIRVLGPIINDIPGYGGGQATPRVKLGVGESMGSQFFNTYTLGDTGAGNALSYIDYVPHHLYNNTGGRNNVAHNANKETWQTEHADTTGRSNAGDTMYGNMSAWPWVWHVMNEVDYCLRVLDDSAFFMWYAKRFYGIIGDGTYSTVNGAVLNRGYAMSHFSKYAANTNRVAVTTSGATFNNSSGYPANDDDNAIQNSDVAKITAYESLDGNSIVVIIFTPRKVAGTAAAATTAGTNLGNVKIQLPAGFAANTVKAMRSNATVKGADASSEVVLTRDRNTAYISVPADNIVSVKFTK
jgi:O-glycosyl hydrolase